MEHFRKKEQNKKRECGGETVGMCHLALNLKALTVIAGVWGRSWAVEMLLLLWFS